jgi:hypothetical protein
MDFADHMRVRVARYHHSVAPFSHVVSASYWKCLLAHEIQFLFELRLAVVSFGVSLTHSFGEHDADPLHRPLRHEVRDSVKVGEP